MKFSKTSALLLLGVLSLCSHSADARAFRELERNKVEEIEGNEVVVRLPPHVIEAADSNSIVQQDVSKKSQYLVKVAKGVDIDELMKYIDEVHEDVDFPSIEVDEKKSFKAIKQWFYIRATYATAMLLQADDRILVVESDRQLYALGLQWGLDRSDQRSLPLDNKYDAGGLTGEGQFVYVIDTGVRPTHEEFGNRVLQGKDLVDGDDYANDGQGHGTHCASSVAGKTLGIAPGAKIIPVRVLDDNGSGYTSTVIEGVNWAVEDAKNRKGGVVLSLSLGGGVDEAMNDAIDAAYEAGIIPVVAAGNENDDACRYSPASAAKAITVGSVTKTDQRSWFSNYGTCVDIFGPGSYILGAGHTGDKEQVTLSGTSMATPHVAGVVSLILEKYSDRKVTVDEIKEELLSSAVPDILDPKELSGSPNLILQVPEAQPQPTAEPTVSPTKSPTAGFWLECKGVSMGYADASFGTPIQYSEIVEGNVVMFDNYGCHPGDLSALEGKTDSIVVVKRGECDYEDKARAAQAWSGVLGLVVINDRGGDATETMGSYGDTSDIQIPCAMISQNSGEALKSKLKSATSIACEWGTIRYQTPMPTPPTKSPTMEPTPEPTQKPTPRTDAPTSQPTGADLLLVDGLSYDFEKAAFGYEMDSDRFLGGISYAGDCCGSLPKNSLVNKMGLCIRGNCPFYNKAVYAQNAGAIAVIVYNNDGDGLIRMGTNVYTPAVNVPVVFIGQSDGEQAKEESETEDIEALLATWHHFTPKPTTPPPTKATKAPTPEPTPEPTTLAPTPEPTTLAPTTASPTKMPTTPQPTPARGDQFREVDCSKLTDKIECGKVTQCMFKKKKCMVNPAATPPEEPGPCSGLSIDECVGNCAWTKVSKKLSTCQEKADDVRGHTPTECHVGKRNEAERYCNDRRMVLCTVQQLEEMLADNVCKVDTKFVWTNDGCDSGKYYTYQKKKKKSACMSVSAAANFRCCKSTM